MNGDLVVIALVVGMGTYLFRALPSAFGSRLPTTGRIGRFLAAIGPAAITALLAASLLSGFGSGALILCLLAGCSASIIAYLLKPSVVIATLVGAGAYGVAYQLLVVHGGG